MKCTQKFVLSLQHFWEFEIMSKEKVKRKKINLCLTLFQLLGLLGFGIKIMHGTFLLS